ncbi:SDR family oxidoreductase [Corynebacterium sp. A21]|uniref:SDR family oxidoreductase n=1 Tax=Corynebacterium sp. A21 TaxID=3457318 RepID=UPI003FD65E9F
MLSSSRTPHAFVTGASGGVGREVVSRLLSRGWRVTAQYRTSPGPAAATWWQADFTRPLPPVEMPTQLDALIHCAGVAPVGPTQEFSREVWEETMAVNLHAPVDLSNRLLPALKAAGGHLVYVNSGAGQQTRPQWTVYSASKFAARAWCDGLRGENPDIRVTSIYPGGIATEMQRKIVGEFGRNWDPSAFLSAGTVASAIINALETPSDAHPTEITLRPR